MRRIGRKRKKMRRRRGKGGMRWRRERGWGRRGSIMRRKGRDIEKGAEGGGREGREGERREEEGGEKESEEEVVLLTYLQLTIQSEEVFVCT